MDLSDINDILTADASDMRRELADHDPVAFTRRLAQRILAEQGPPPDSAFRRADRSPAAARPATAPRAPQRRAHPALTAPADRRGQAQDLGQMCTAVLAGADVEVLADFVTLTDNRGAVAFACLLHSLGKPQQAAFWWRFADGADSALAGHFLAAHYTSTGQHRLARHYRDQARVVPPEDLPELTTRQPPPDRRLLAQNLLDQLEDQTPKDLWTWDTASSDQTTGTAPRQVTGKRRRRRAAVV